MVLLPLSLDMRHTNARNLARAGVVGVSVTSGGFCIKINLARDIHVLHYWRRTPVAFWERPDIPTQPTMFVEDSVKPTIKCKMWKSLPFCFHSFPGT